jgi:hypothetical protein
MWCRVGRMRGDDEHTMMSKEQSCELRAGNLVPRYRAAQRPALQTNEC